MYNLVIKLIFSKKALFLKSQPSNVFGYGKPQIRKAFHNSRQSRKGGLEPDPLQNIHFDSAPLNLKALFKPFVFTVGVSSTIVIPY